MGILVTGSSGRLGRVLCRLLQAEQIAFVGTTRQQNKTNDNTRFLDLDKPQSIPQAIQGIDTIVHLASDTKRFKAQTDIGGTKALLQAAKDAGIKHFIYISIVGVDKMPLKYYQTKLQTEVLVAQSGIPYSILRTTQYYYFVEQLCQAYLRLPLTFFPKQILVQPMDEAVAAQQIIEIYKKAPSNGITEIGGRTVFRMGDLAKDWITARRKSVWVLGIPTWGKALKAGANGALTCPDHAIDAGLSWKEWLNC